MSTVRAITDGAGSAMGSTGRDRVGLAMGGAGPRPLVAVESSGRADRPRQAVDSLEAVVIAGTDRVTRDRNPPGSPCTRVMDYPARCRGPPQMLGGSTASGRPRRPRGRCASAGFGLDLPGQQVLRRELGRVRADETDGDRAARAFDAGQVRMGPSRCRSRSSRRGTGETGAYSSE